MNELEIKRDWLKIQINSYYGSKETNKVMRSKWIFHKMYIKIKNKIRLINNRKSKIKKIWKIDGIV